MPARMLRDWTDSLKLDGISAEAERLLVRLIMKADDYGRFHADSRLIKAAGYPLIDNLRANDLDRSLDELSARQLILRYEADGRSCLAIVNYGQRLKSSKAKFPPLPGEPIDWLPTSGMFQPNPGDSGGFREVPGSSGKFPLEEKGREEEGKGRERARPEPVAKSAEDPLVSMEAAIGYAPMARMTEEEASHWWHTRNSSGWTKSSASGGHPRPITSWQSDMAASASWVRESMAKQQGSMPNGKRKVSL